MWREIISLIENINQLNSSCQNYIDIKTQWINYEIINNSLHLEFRFLNHNYLLQKLVVGESDLQFLKAFLEKLLLINRCKFKYLTAYKSHFYVLESSTRNNGL